jgi:hypothetical protein
MKKKYFIQNLSKQLVIFYIFRQLKIKLHFSSVDFFRNSEITPILQKNISLNTQAKGVLIFKRRKR